MFENPRRLRQARNFTTNLPKILDLKSSSEQIFSENWRWVSLCVFTSWAQALARVQTFNKNIIANMRQYLYLSCRSRFYSYAAHVYAFCSAVWEDQTCGEHFLRTPSWFITTRAKRKPLTKPSPLCEALSQYPVKCWAAPVQRIEIEYVPGGHVGGVKQ